MPLAQTPKHPEISLTVQLKKKRYEKLEIPEEQPWLQF